MCVLVMVSVLLVIITAAAVAAADDFTIRCTNNSSLNGMTFEPVIENIVGRYKLELCTEVKPDYKEWEVDVRFQNQTSSCVNNWKKFKQFVPHSSNYEYIDIDKNCTHACLTKKFDLIFASCYSIESKFLLDDTGGQYRKNLKPTTYIFNVNNSYTLTQFTAVIPTVHFAPHEKGISIIWYAGIPVQDFKVEICNANVTSKEYDTLPCLMNTSSMCSFADATTAASVRCWVPTPDYCISVKFTHIAPWISGRLQVQGAAHIPYIHCPQGARLIDVNGSSWTGVIAAGVVFLVGVVVLGARQVWSTRRAQLARKHVLKLWLQTNSNETTSRVERTTCASTPSKPSRHILLLHARENDAGQRLVDALTTILQAATQGQVYSLYSASVMCLAGAAPGEWVRAAFARPDVAVVLLETPALQALYGTSTSGGEEGGQVTVSPPLFPHSVAPRSPSFGDTLLQYALRLINDTDTAHSYHKLYIATLSQLPTEVFPHVVPYRRYLLPETASLLARDASANFGQLPPLDPLTDKPALTIDTDNVEAKHEDVLDVKQELLAEAVAYFVEIVKDNPRYLMDELVVL